MDKKVEWAVIPAAGRGTRFLPITKGVSKEMLNIVDRPTIEYIVDECVSGGIKNIVFVVSKTKEDVRKYYTQDEEFKEEMLKAKKQEYYDILDSIPRRCNFYFVEQKETLGLGHAVLMAKDIIKDNNFVVCCGDDITDFEGHESPIKELVDAFLKVGCKTIVGGKKVKHEDIVKYGCMDIKEDFGDGLVSLKGIVEKPSLEEATSDYASLGKWVFNSKIFEAIEKTPRGKGNEIQLTDAIETLRQEEGAYFKEFKATRFDCGDKVGYLKAVLNFAFKKEDYKKELLDFIEEIK